MFLKTYSKKSIENNTAKLTIKGKEISLKKNEKFKVYEDNDVVIYDILELATGKTAESYIKQRAKEEDITSSDYILSVRKKVLAELKK